MSSATQTTEARELALVDKVEFRIALADSDTKLQNILKTYLAPLLLKLDSAHASVRQKIITICQQIVTRIQPPNIQLPVQVLLKQYKDNQQSRLVRHFDLLFLQHGIARSSPSERAALVPLLVPGIASCASVAQSQGAKILNFLFRALANYQLPLRGQKESESLRSALGASDEDASFLAFWFGKLFLLRIGSKSSSSVNSGPGISSDEWSFLTVEGHSDTWNPSKEGGLNLTDIKLRCLKLLESGFFKDNERFLPSLLASADANSAISEVAEDVLKRALPNVNLEDISLIKQLFDYCQGYSTNNSEAPNTLVPAVSTSVRTKIVEILSRSVASTTFTAAILRIVEKDLLQDFQVSNAVTADRELSKLRSSIVSYLHYIARNAAPDDLATIAASVIRHLREFIEQEAHNTRSLESRHMRGTSFSVIGNLAAADSSILIEPDLDLLTWLFQSLSQEPDKEILVSIDEALSSVLRPFHRVQGADLQLALAKLLLNNMNQDSPNSRNVRYASIRYANRCLQFQNIHARWIDIIALSDPSYASHETISEAKDGLNPHWHHTFEASNSKHPEIAFPSFPVLADYFFWERDAQKSPETLVLAIDFCRKTLMWESLKAQGYKIPLDFQWDLKLDQAISDDNEARNSIRKQLSFLAEDKDSRTALLILWNSTLFGSCSDEITFAKRASVAGILLELCTLLPSRVLGQLVFKFKDLAKGVYSNDQTLRLYSAQSYGILTSRPECDMQAVQRSIDWALSIIRSHGGTSFAQANKIHGGFIATSHFASRCLHLNPDNNLGQRVLKEVLAEALQLQSENTNSLVHEASLHAISQLCMFYLIKWEMIESHITLEKLLEVILKRAKSGSATAIKSLGYISMIFDEDTQSDKLQQCLNNIKDLHEIKEAETQFTVGESLVCAAVGWKSSIMPPQLDIQSSIPQGPHRLKTLEPLLDGVLNDCATTTKPALKKASVIWLLSFVQFCGDEPEVQNRLRKIQIIFRRCLSNRDEFVQEGASRGLSLVYEKGNPEIKKALVRDLVESFSSNRADMSGSVTQDTQLFEAGAMPIGEGSSVNTYKDIMSLASDIGDSSLVYHFMSLASSDSIWSNRAAFGRFGLNNVLSDAAIAGYLDSNPKLYSKLYRYRFDPNPKVQRSMNDIWNSLVDDFVVVLDDNFDAIMNDLLENMVSKEWRAREASCAAAAALIQSSRPEKVIPRLEAVLECNFLVLDDIKDSVVRGALSLIQTLWRFMQQRLQLDDSDSESSHIIMSKILPRFLSASWLESKSKIHESLGVVISIDIIRKAKPETLGPLVPELVDNLLNLLVKDERQAIDYAQLNAQNLNLDSASIDRDRAKNVRSSSIMETIERCLDLLNETTMRELSNRFPNTMRLAISIPTKIGCSQVLMSLSVRKTNIFRPYADRFLDIIPKYLTDRSDAVATSYALALGYVARAASDSGLSRLCQLAQKLYLESDEDRSRKTAGAIVHGLAKFSSDRFNDVAEEFLPFVFFALHDENEDVRKTFEETWENSTGGPRRVMLYLNEIADLSRNQLAASRWNIKRAAALTITEAVELITKSKGQLSAPESNLIWPLLKIALAERSWAGKEKLLPGFVAFVKHGASTLDVGDEIAKIILREAKRRNPTYQSFVIQSLGEIVGLVRASDLSSNEVYEVCAAIVEHYEEETSEKTEKAEGSDGQQQKNRCRALTGTLDSIFQAMKSRKEEIGEASSVAARIATGLDLAGKAYATSHFDRVIQSSMFVNLKLFFEDLQARKTVYEILFEADPFGSTFLPEQITNGLLAPQDALAHAPELLRLQRSEAILALARLYCQYDKIPAPPAFLTLPILDERSQQARQNLQEAVQIFRTLEQR